MKGRKKPEGSGTAAQKISVMDLETKLTTVYDSMSDAAEALGIKISRISSPRAARAVQHAATLHSYCAGYVFS